MPTTHFTDLWPSDLLASPGVSTPASVLRHQGEALGARTHNFVLGEVDTNDSSDGRQFTHFFVLVAPFLRYRRALLKITHGLQPYPAAVVETELTKQPDENYWSREVANEQELKDALREFFGQDRVKEVIRAVTNISNDVASPENGAA